MPRMVWCAWCQEVHNSASARKDVLKNAWEIIVYCGPYGRDTVLDVILSRVGGAEG